MGGPPGGLPGRGFRPRMNFGRQISRYIFRQAILPFVGCVAAFTAIVWLSQSLRLLDLVINQGQSAGTFAYLSLMVLPSLLIHIVPAAFLCAVLFTLNRFHQDSETAVMSAAGMGRWTILKPLMTLGALVAGLVALLNLWLMPLGMHEMKQQVFEIRSDLAATVFREGAFTTPAEGLTVFVRERTSGGAVSGILVHDNRDGKHPVTYMAERGLLTRSEEGPRLVMEEGVIQRVEAHGRLATLDFTRYVFDLTPFMGSQRQAVREANERYLPELLDPQGTTDREIKRRGNYIAEGHNRLAQPLYPFLFVLFAGAFLLTGTFSRRGYAWRVVAAGTAALVVRLMGVGIASMAASSPALIFFIYLIPVLFGGVAIAIIQGWLPSPFDDWRKKPTPADAVEGAAA